MYFQLLSGEHDVRDRMAGLLSQIYNTNTGGLFKRALCVRFHVFKDKEGRVCFVAGSSDKDYAFEKMLQDAYGEHFVKPMLAVPTIVDGGRNVALFDKFHAIDPGALWESLIFDIPKDVMLTFTFAKTRNKAYEQQLTQLESALLKKADKTTKAKERLKDIQNKIGMAHHAFDCELSVAPLDNSGKESIYNLIKNIRIKSETRHNHLRVASFSNGSFSRSIDISHHVFSLTAVELAGFLSIPKVTDKNMHILHVGTDGDSVAADDIRMGIKIGTVLTGQFKGEDIRIPPDLIAKHLLLTGATGGGKSSVLFEIVDDMIATVDDNGEWLYGFTCFDPKQETVIKIINHLLAREAAGHKINWHKVHYIDLAQGQYLPQMNLLNIPTGASVDAVQGYILDLLKTIYNSGATPLMDKMFRNGIGTLLLEQKQKNTILDIQELFDDRKRQQLAMRRLGNDFFSSNYKKFWGDPQSDEMPFTRSEVASTMNRLDLFASPRMMKLYGLPEFNLEIERWMDEGHIVLINTRGMSDNEITLNGGHILSQYTMVAKNRDMKKARPHFLIIDEGKQFQVPVIYKNIIPEMRYYMLWLIFATQIIQSLKDELKTEMAENVGTKITGRQGDDGAKKMSDIMNGKVTKKTIQNLLDGELLAYIQTKDAGFQVVPIKAKPPYWYLPDGKIAEYKNKVHEEIALDWTNKKIMELQQRDWLHVDEIDRLLAERYHDGVTIESSWAQSTPMDQNLDALDLLGDFDN
ncbi:hypothetical protein [Culicoidibacter larvae]|uniref:Uncharacterized protein n=1 Tax=Culicoidibacter larvae TaxID=2579976 RepID=A0A5R8Q8D1_9FIRM|nr:hypothetical protein [Culicoidibacter larvae]TLG71074.1 hypothetical protein FEZ08_11725 [Culicoidibacter larvae]